MLSLKQIQWRKQLILWCYIALVCILLRAAFFYQNLQISLQLPEQSENPYLFLVDSGDSFSKISNELVALGILESSFDIQVFARLSGKASQIKKGQYILEESMTALDLLNKLVAGDVYYHKVRILEGWTLKEAVQAIQNHPEIVLELNLNKPDALQAAFLTDYYPEGLLFPDTYNFTSGTTDLQILDRARRYMQEVLDQEWAKRSVGLPYDTSYQALIMASIIEKETGQPDERALIAAVFVNRLRQNMRLQTDPTVIYGLGDRFDGDLTRANLQESTPYNTYRNNGLPPTPIALPGREAIEAALNPDMSAYLYFVAKGDGSHYFSSTLEEHNSAVREFQLGNQN